MATKEKDTNKELEVEEIVSKSEQFIENNSKKIIYGIIAVALVGCSGAIWQACPPASLAQLARARDL